MTSPLTATFVRSLQPLVPSDRRALLKELGVTGVSSRDEDGFYEWLAARYRAGALASVDLALKRCCTKADERTGAHRVVSWLAQQAGYRGAPPVGDEDQLRKLVSRARASSLEAAALIDALAPNFAWFGLPFDAGPGRPVALDAAALADRLARGLAALADEPDIDLLLRADDLAGAIEDHLARASDRAERQVAQARAEAALAAVRPAIEVNPLDLAGLSLDGLREVAEAGEEVLAALAADTRARGPPARG